MQLVHLIIIIKLGLVSIVILLVFSFHPVKIITTGEGGMALTNDQKTCTSYETS